MKDKEAQKNELNLRVKLRNWVPIVNPAVWQILRLVERGSKGIRELREAGFKGSPVTLGSYVNLLEKRGFISTRISPKGHHKRLVKLTDKGVKALKWIDELGELVKETS